MQGMWLVLPLHVITRIRGIIIFVENVFTFLFLLLIQDDVQIPFSEGLVAVYSYVCQEICHFVTFSFGVIKGEGIVTAQILDKLAQSGF